MIPISKPYLIFFLGLALWTTATQAYAPHVLSDSELHPSCVRGEKRITSESWIGKEHNVQVEVSSCASTDKPSVSPRALVEARQTNVCGGPACNRICFTPSGGGPDPNHCNVIADALRYESENTGPLFPIGTGTNNTITMKYSTCKTFFVNQDLADVVYCRTEWASLVDSIAFNCQATQNAHGGLCVASNQTWFVQVQHV